MSAKDVRHFMRRIADLFMEGDLEGTVRFHAHPLVVYSANGIRLERTETDIYAALFALRKAARDAGVSSIELSIGAFDLQGARRCRVAVRWHFRREDGSTVGTSDLSYFLVRNPETGYLIQLMEIHDTSFPHPRERSATDGTTH